MCLFCSDFIAIKSFCCIIIGLRPCIKSEYKAFVFVLCMEKDINNFSLKCKLKLNVELGRKEL